MSNEIEEFLRRAAQRRAAQQAAQSRPAQPPQGQPPQGQPPQGQPPQGPTRLTPPPQAVRQQQVPTPPLVEQVVQAEVVDAALAPTGEGVAQHVNQFLDSHQFAERASHLGELAGQADDSMQEHLHKTFDHKIGKLAGETHTLTAEGPETLTKPEEIVRSSNSAAEEMVKLLQSPQTLRSVILLSEVLSVPKNRW